MALDQWKIFIEWISLDFRTQFRSSHEQTHHGTAHTNTRTKYAVKMSSPKLLDNFNLQHFKRFIMYATHCLTWNFGFSIWARAYQKKTVSLLFSRYSRHSWSNLRSINVVIQLKCELKHSTNHIWIFAFDIERIFGQLAINKSDGDALSIQHFDLVRRTTITV